jgi:hypothetical protein
MDAIGYKIETDGTLWFSWVFVNTDGETIWLSGAFGTVQQNFIKLGSEFTPQNFGTKTIVFLQNLGYVFDFNDKCSEVLVRFPLANIEDLYDFRFQRVELLMHAVLQRSGNGFCDYGFCDEAYLNMTCWVYSAEVASQTFLAYLPKVLKTNELNFEVWSSIGGVPQRKLGIYA